MPEQPRTAQDAAQIAIGAIRAANGHMDTAKRLIEAAGLTTAEMLQAIAHLESGRPLTDD